MIDDQRSILVFAVMCDVPYNPPNKWDLMYEPLFSESSTFLA
jgi:hypothetical protein